MGETAPIIKVVLRSRSDGPVRVQYDGEELIIPPKGKTKKLVESKLGSVNPSEVQIIR